ncbi:Sucrose transport protein SUT4 [Capsicum chinense]|nr:Sucrose transport protein SUT4 [Capsicum chinense]
MMEKRSTRNTPQMEKSQLNCMWGLISSLYFGQNQRKQKLLSNGKVATKNFIGTLSRAAIIFVIGFWMLDLANNTVQGSARAFLADLSGPAQRNTANAVFCSWMTVGNFLGFSAGACGGWHRLVVYSVLR